MKRRVEAALDASADLRRLFEEAKDEAEIVEAVKDSRAIRLSERDEDRIVNKVVDGLRTAFDTPGA